MGGSPQISSADPKGYYACLGISPSATADEIKAAFRQRAKEFHPDRNPDPRAKFQFQSIGDAYAVLSDSKARASYDSDAAKQEAKPNSDAPLEPVACSKCGSITAQPRYAVFQTVFSAILVTTRKPVQGIFCAECSQKVALQASLTSAVAGWWGLPWGPIYTIIEVVRNAFGGFEPPGARESLTWRNAVAFASRGNLNLSYALARTLRTAKDESLAMAALRLMDVLQARGVKPEEAHLKSIPKFSPLYAGIQLGAVSILPLALIVWAYTSSENSSSSFGGSNWQVMGSPPDQSVVQPTPAPAQVAPATVPQAPPVPTCAAPPSNGQVLFTSSDDHNEAHTIEIENGSTGNAIVKVRDSQTLNEVVAFFVASNSTASYAFIPDGTYIIQYAFGTDLDASCTTFAAMTGAAQFPSTETFSTRFENDQIVHQILTYTLYPVVGGTVSPNSIDAAAFNAH